MLDEPDYPFRFRRQGILFLISAPSGAGKTTLSGHLLQRLSNLSLSVSYTTRLPRQGEQDGREYHFIGEAEFSRLREAHAFAEWARVHDCYYGTARAPLDEGLASGQDLLLDIDVQGVKQLRALYPTSSVAIFLLPPSWKELEQRLRSRHTESEEAITRRLKRAHEEAKELPMYHYLVINDDIERAVTTLQAIVLAERARISRLEEKAIV
ncbi:MAG: guanylate kinase [Candidatus Binatia bacterium]